MWPYISFANLSNTRMVTYRCNSKLMYSYTSVGDDPQTLPIDECEVFISTIITNCCWGFNHGESSQTELQKSHLYSPMFMHQCAWALSVTWSTYRSSQALVRGISWLHNHIIQFSEAESSPWSCKWKLDQSTSAKGASTTWSTKDWIID